MWRAWVRGKPSRCASVRFTSTPNHLPFIHSQSIHNQRAYLAHSLDNTR